MQPCKAKLSDGKPCPNQADDGQDYCFFHLAEQDSKLKKEILKSIKDLGVLSVVFGGIYKVGKFVASKKL